MTRISLISVALGFAVLAGCTKEPPPRTVAEFLEDPHLLEAALVRCTVNRSESRYTAECVNAREATKQLEAEETAKQREQLEAQSQRKRAALRRSQSAAAAARREAEENRRRQEEADYLANFGAPLPGAEAPVDSAESNVPVAIIPASDSPNETPVDEYGDNYVPVSTSTEGGNDAPTSVENYEPMPANTEEDSEGVDSGAADLNEIRDELKRRSQEGDGSGSS